MSKNSLPLATRLLRKVEPNPIGVMLAGPFRDSPPLQSLLGDWEADRQAALRDLAALGADFDAALARLQAEMPQLPTAGQAALPGLEDLKSSDLREAMTAFQADYDQIVNQLAAHMEEFDEVSASLGDLLANLESRDLAALFEVIGAEDDETEADAA